MKYLKLAILTAVLLSSTINTSKAQVYKNSDLVLNLFYGSPSLATLYTDNYLVNFGIDNFYSLGPIGIQGEYLLNKRIGLGLEASYSNSSFDFTENGDYYKYSLSKARVMPRFSVHLGNSTKFDNHFSFAIGYKYSNVIVTSNNPDLEEVRGYENEIENLLNVFSLPIGLRISYGAKYFFTDDLALALDIGIGGGTIFTGGLSYKINFQKDVPN